MRLFDTARREVVPFEPGPIVTMYTCGITPYDATHLGHAATYIAFDLLLEANLILRPHPYHQRYAHLVDLVDTTASDAIRYAETAVGTEAKMI